MNTRRRMILAMAGLMIVSLLAQVAIVYMIWINIVPAWSIFVAIALPVCELPLVMKYARRFKKRFEEAKLRGRTLCSRCEYEIPDTQDKVPCPECGIVRSNAEHREVLESWNLWKS
jgi:predicted RNA-binding Zn-ribbon protein involved in translation (DUF1610 family)